MFFLKAGFPSSDHPRMVMATVSNMFAMCSRCGEEVHIFQPEVVENINALLFGRYICPVCRTMLVHDGEPYDDDDMMDEEETEDELDVYEDENCQQDENSDDEREARHGDDQDDHEGIDAEVRGCYAVQEQEFYRYEMIGRMRTMII